MEKLVKLFGTTWKDQPVQKMLLACISMASSKVPVDLSNRYQWSSKAFVKILGVLDGPQGSRSRGTCWKTGSLRPFPTGSHRLFSSSARALSSIVISVHLTNNHLIPSIINYIPRKY